MIPEIYGVSKMTRKLCCRPNICYKPKKGLQDDLPRERHGHFFRVQFYYLKRQVIFYFTSKYGT